MKNTVKKNSAKRTLAGILATASLAAVTLPTAAVMMPGLTAHAYATAWSESKDEIDEYFEDQFKFDKSTYFTRSVEDETKSKTQMVQNADGSISLVRKEQIPDNTTFRSFGVANADSNIIYPGAMLKADRDLVTGNPTPIRLGRRDVNICVPRAKMKDGCKSFSTVNPGSASVVNDAISADLVGKFRDDADCAAQVTTKIEKVESDEQIKAKMNFSNEMWANLKVSSSADYHKNQQSVVVDISQVFYTVAADVQTSADLFPDEMPLSRIRKYITPDSPAVVVSSVDYGKRVVACIQTNDMSFDLKASVSASGLGGKVKGDAEGSYDTKLKNCTVNLFVAGGSSESAGKYFKDISIDKLLETAASQTKYDGYAVPVSYTTRWAHDGSVATAAYHGYEWQTVTTKQLAKNQPVTVKFDQIDRENIKTLNVKVFGRKIQSIDNNNAFILGEEEQIADYTRNCNGSLYFDLDASIAKDTVRFVFDYTGDAGQPAEEKDRTVYLSDLVSIVESTAKIGGPNSNTKKATAADIEDLSICFKGSVPFVDIYVTGKLSKEFGEETKCAHANLCKGIAPNNNRPMYRAADGSITYERPQDVQPSGRPVNKI